MWETLHRLYKCHPILLEELLQPELLPRTQKEDSFAGKTKNRSREEDSTDIADQSCRFTDGKTICQKNRSLCANGP